MKKMIVSSLILAATAFSAPFVHAASPSVVGSWNVTFYLEPLRATGAVQCIELKSVPGTVAGVPTSGTWSSPTFPGWSGEWIQLGDHVRIFGLTSALATTSSGNMINRNIFGGVSFNHYNKTTGATSSAGSWLGVRVAACRTDASSTRGDGDPANDVKHLAVE